MCSTVRLFALRSSDAFEIEVELGIVLFLKQ